MNTIVKILGLYVGVCAFTTIATYYIVSPIIDKIDRKEMDMHETNKNNKSYDIGNINIYYRELRNAKVV